MNSLQLTVDSLQLITLQANPPIEVIICKLSTIIICNL